MELIKEIEFTLIAVEFVKVLFQKIYPFVQISGYVTVFDTLLISLFVIDIREVSVESQYVNQVMNNISRLFTSIKMYRICFNAILKYKILYTPYCLTKLKMAL